MMNPQLMTAGGSLLTGFAEDVRSGLTRPGEKQIPPKYLYDAVGSALFEVITLLPEYGLARADRRLLDQSAPALAARGSSRWVVAELGSGSSRKASRILSALSAGAAVTYRPIELSHPALARCIEELHETDVRVEPVEGDYLDGLSRVANERRRGERLAVLFLGSSIGNFDPVPALDFLRAIQRQLCPGDFVLLSTDLVKPAEQLRLAYDDPAGVTAVFNLNLLARINRELSADFDLRQFHHHAFYNEQCQRVELRLISAKRQTVLIERADLTVTLERGESIWTESSYKYRALDVVEMADEAGFHCDDQWIDGEWPFAQTLLKK